MATTPHDSSPEDEGAEHDKRVVELLLLRQRQLIEESTLHTPPLDPGSTGAAEDTPVEDASILNEASELDECLLLLEQARREESARDADTSEDSSQLFEEYWNHLGESNDGSPAGDSLPKQQIGRFQIVRELGRGGLGLVLLANDPLLRRQVALKVPRPEALFTQSLRHRFSREAMAAARLTHPGIVPVYEVGEAGPIMFIAAAFIEGKSLAASLHELGRPDDPRIGASIVAELAEAMHYAHTQGVLHRDLKPANVLLEPRPIDGPSIEEKAASASAIASWNDPRTVKITDFGLAKIIDLAGDETRSGAIIGTPAYMAPEQAKADLGRIGPLADVYALGVILYELLTGDAPFRAPSDAEILRLVVSEEPVPPRQLNSLSPRDLEAICLKCMEKSPAQRYQSAGDLAADLRRFLSGEPTLARPLSTLGQVLRWAGRNRRVATLLGMVAGLLLCVTIVSTVAAVNIARARDEAERIAERERQANKETERALLAEKESLAKALAAEKTAEKERATAQTQAAKAEQVSEFLVNLFMTADPLGIGKLGFRQPDEIGANLTLRDLLDRGSKQSQNVLKTQPVARASLLDTLGKVYCNLGLLEQAEPLIREAYELRLTHPENEADLASSLFNMGVLTRLKGNYKEAESFLRRAMEIRSRVLGINNLATAEIEIILAWTLIESQRFGSPDHPEYQAEFDKLAQHALAVQQRELGANHRDVGVTYLIMSWRYSAVKDFAAMEKMLLAAVKAFAKQEAGKSLTHALVDYQLAALARRQRKYPKAEKHYRASIEMLRNVMGRANPYTLVISADFAGMLRETGQMLEFERMGSEVAENLLRAFPHGHPMFIEVFNEWIRFIASQGKFDDAIKLIERKRITEEQFLGPSPLRDAEKTMLIADCRIDQGRLEEAARLLEASQKMFDSLQPPVHDLEQDWIRGKLVGATGDLAEQERIWRDCIRQAIKPKHLAVDWPSALADSIHSQRPNDPETEKLISIPPGNPTDVLVPDYPHVADRYLFCIRMLIDRGRLAEAETLLKPVHESVHQKTMPNNFRIGLADSLMGALLAAKGDNEAAEPLLIAGFENLRKSRNDNHHLTRQALDRLLSFYRKTENAEKLARYEHILEPVSSQPTK